MINTAMMFRTSLKTFGLFLAAALLPVLSLPGGTANDEFQITEFSEHKSEVTVLVTDSGLGGLSVAAEIERRLHACHPWAKVRLVFANALAGNDHTYNQMASTEEQANVFSSALEAFVRQYHPDLILIACNTLSVVYPETRFATTTDIPVLGIVDFGIDMVVEHLEQNPGRAVILGTATTAESGAHKTGIVKRGIAADQILVQGCPMLESEIQADPASDIVATMIEMYALEALADDPGDGDLAVALCCTHYGYAAETFKRVFEDMSGRSVTVLNPNNAMAAALFARAECSAHERTDVSVEVVSQAELGVEDIVAIAGMLAPTSQATAEALRAYTHDEHMFTWVEEH